MALACLFVLLSPAHAGSINTPLKNFNAVFDVRVFGFNIGDTSHKMKCQENLCQLTSEATPSRWARRWINEETVEVIQLDQSNNDIKLLEYKKYLTRHIDAQSIQKTTTIQRDLKNNQLHFIEGQKTFNPKPHAFDLISLAYAIQYLVINQQPLNSLFLQDDKNQQKIVFSEVFKEHKIYLDFSGHIASQRFSFSNDKISAKLWLIPELNHFPGKIEVHNKETDRKITLELQKKPNFNL